MYTCVEPHELEDKFFRRYDWGDERTTSIRARVYGITRDAGKLDLDRFIEAHGPRMPGPHDEGRMGLETSILHSVNAAYIAVRRAQEAGAPVLADTFEALSRFFITGHDYYLNASKQFFTHGRDAERGYALAMQSIRDYLSDRLPHFRPTNLRSAQTKRELGILLEKLRVYDENRGPAYPSCPYPERPPVPAGGARVIALKPREAGQNNL